MRTISRLLVALALAVGLAAPAAAWGPTVDVSPDQPSPGSTITVSGSGWTPGHQVDLGFLGLTVTTVVGDDGTFSAQITIPLDTPTDEGAHPLDVEIYGEGGLGYIFLTLDVDVVAAPEPTTTTEATTTTSSPPPTTQPPPATTGAPATTAETSTTKATATTIDDGTSTTGASTTVPGSVTSTIAPGAGDGGGGGFPWWVVGILLVALVLGGLLRFVRWPWQPEPAFIDSSGQGWLWCASSACTLEQGLGRDANDKREVRVRAQPHPKKACPGGCSCVLFYRPRGKTQLDFVNDDHGWVPRTPGGKYLARCVKKG